MQKDLLLEYKPLVEWLKASVVYDKITFVLSVNTDTVLLSVNN